MQAALNCGKSRPKTLVPRQIVGVAALLLTGAAVTPMNIQEVPRFSDFEAEAAPVAHRTGGLSQQLDPQLIKTDQNIRTLALLEQKQETLQLRDKIVSSVLDWQGIKYKWGGQTRAGIDCSGLVQRIYKEQGVMLPRTSFEQFRQGVGIPKSKLEPGDLVFFNTNGAGASHVGIYIGDGDFISATKHCVQIQSLEDPYWNKTYRGSRRVIG